MIYHSERATSHNLRKKILKMLRLLQKTTYIHKKKDEQDEIIGGIFHQKELINVN